MPETYDPLVDAIDEDALRQTFSRIRSIIRRNAEAMPTHGDFIARHCAAPAPQGAIRTAYAG
jgi:tryptophan halogenase